jgi:hypothetical protein
LTLLFEARLQKASAEEAVIDVRDAFQQYGRSVFERDQRIVTVVDLLGITDRL